MTIQNIKNVLNSLTENNIQDSQILKYKDEFDDYWKIIFEPLILNISSQIDDTGIHKSIKDIFLIDFIYKKMNLSDFWDISINSKEQLLQILNYLGIQSSDIINDYNLKEFILNIINLYKKIGKEESFRQIMSYTKHQNYEVSQLKLNKLNDDLYFIIDNNGKEKYDYSISEKSEHWKNIDLTKYNNLYEIKTNLFLIEPNITQNSIFLSYMTYLLDHNFEEYFQLPLFRINDMDITFQDLFNLYCYKHNKNINKSTVPNNVKAEYINIDNYEEMSYYDFKIWINNFLKYPNISETEYSEIYDKSEYEKELNTYNDIFNLNIPQIKKYKNDILSGNFNDIYSYNYQNLLQDIENNQINNSNDNIFYRLRKQTSINMDIPENILLSSQQNDKIQQIGGGIDKFYLLSREYINKESILNKDILNLSIFMEDEIYLQSNIYLDHLVKVKDDYFIKKSEYTQNESKYKYYKAEDSDNINLESDEYFYKYQDLTLNEQINNKYIYIYSKNQLINSVTPYKKIELPFNMTAYGIEVIDDKYVVIYGGIYFDDVMKFNNKLYIYDLYSNQFIEESLIANSSQINLLFPNIYFQEEINKIIIYSGYQFLNNDLNIYDKSLYLIWNTKLSKPININTINIQNENISKLIKLSNILKISDKIYKTLYISENIIYGVRYFEELNNYVKIISDKICDLDENINKYMNYMLFVFDNNIILLGGYDKYYNFNNNIYYYSIDNNKWYYEKNEYIYSQNQIISNKNDLYLIYCPTRDYNKILISNNIYNIHFFNDENIKYLDSQENSLITPVTNVINVENDEISYNLTNNPETYQEELFVLMRNIDEYLFKNQSEILRLSEAFYSENIQNLYNLLNEPSLDKIKEWINEYFQMLTSYQKDANIIIQSNDNVDIKNILELLSNFKLQNQEFILNESKLNIKNYPDDISSYGDGTILSGDIQIYDNNYYSDKIEIEIL